MLLLALFNKNIQPLISLIVCITCIKEIIGHANLTCFYSMSLFEQTYLQTEGL